ncbi:MAG: GNAT family N-acetyltransferase [Planctomycetota bacterium]
MGIHGRYYAEFQDQIFVIQVEAEAVENRATLRSILRGTGNLLRHGIRVVLVFGKGTKIENQLQSDFGAVCHGETSRLVIPESALAPLQQERGRIAHWIEWACKENEIPCRVLPPGMIQVERRIGHDSTGVPTHLNTHEIRNVLERRQLAVLGFGGEDARGRFLHVPSVSLAAELAVELQARKLLFLMQEDGIMVPRRDGARDKLSFADLEQLLCLLQLQREDGQFVIHGSMLPKLHGSIQAVAGGVTQIHLVSHSHLLDEILTRTGAGTMIERRQGHHVDFARAEDVEEIERLHAESQRVTSAYGTPYVKPLAVRELKRLLPRTLLLKHRGIVIGKLHVVPVPHIPRTFQIGGFVVGENHQDSQQGQLLLSEALARLRGQDAAEAVAITASPRARALFERLGGQVTDEAMWQNKLLNRAKQRYAPAEQNDVVLVAFQLR